MSLPDYLLEEPNDPAECEIEACATCRAFWIDENQDRGYRSRHGE